MIQLVIALIIAFIFIIYTGGIPLLRRGLWGEAAVFFGLTLLAGYFSFGQVMQLDIYNPLEGINYILNPLVQLIFS